MVYHVVLLFADVKNVGKSDRDGIMLHNMIFLLGDVHTIYDYELLYDDTVR